MEERLRVFGLGVMVFVGVVSGTVTVCEAQAYTRDTVQLGVLQHDAAAADPRSRQIRLQAAQTALRVRDIDAERLPAVSGDAHGQYQSDVVTIPIQLPNGVRVPVPPHDTYDAYVGVQQRLIDPSLGARRGVERAQLAESQARVETALYGLRQEVNEAFFSAALLQEQVAQVSAATAALESRVSEARARVLAGAALPSDTAALQAVLLQQREQEDELRANRRAALKVLGDLAGRALDDSTVLVVPDMTREFVRVQNALDSVRARPEFVQFARAQDRLRAQAEVVSSAVKPSVSAFGRVGYGRPGLNLLSDQFDTYWLAGVQVRWAPWNWGSTRREREALDVQRAIVASDEAAFAATLRRAVERDLANLDRLERIASTDDRIVALRESVERETRARFAEGEVTGSEYATRQSDVLAARVARVQHRIERAQARVRVLTTLGVEER